MTAEELKGRVTLTGPGQVTLEIEGDLLPATGDAVRILTEVPGIGPQPIRGDWKVSQITEESVIAEPTAVDMGEPKPGSQILRTGVFGWLDLTLPNHRILSGCAAADWKGQEKIYQ